MGQIWNRNPNCVKNCMKNSIKKCLTIMPFIEKWALTNVPDYISIELVYIMLPEASKSFLFTFLTDPHALLRMSIMMHMRVHGPTYICSTNKIL